MRRPGAGIRFMTERDRIVLPEPDSPTNAIISLLFICNEILSNTNLLVFPSSFGKSTLTFSTESRIVFPLNRYVVRGSM